MNSYPPAPCRRATLGATLLGVLVTLGAAAQESDADGIRWTHIAPGIEAALPHHAARFDDGNSIRIVTADGVVLIDAPTDPEVAAGWIERTRAEGRTVRFVLSTHRHSDHHQTTSKILDAYPEATFVGHRTLQSKIENEVAAEHRARLERLQEQVPAAKAALAEGRGLSGDPLSEEQQEAQRTAIAGAEAWIAANAEVSFAVPTVGITATTSFDVGGVLIEAHSFRAHTDGDLVVVLPAHGIALTGDLLDDLPFIGHGAPRSWIRALDVIAHWPVQTFVPGHGEPFGKAHLRKVRSFLMDVVATVDTAKEQGADLDTVLAGAAESPRLLVHRAALAPDASAQRFFDGTLPAALRAAWNEVPSD